MIRRHLLLALGGAHLAGALVACAPQHPVRNPSEPGYDASREPGTGPAAPGGPASGVEDDTESALRPDGTEADAPARPATPTAQAPAGPRPGPAPLPPPEGGDEEEDPEQGGPGDPRVRFDPGSPTIPPPESAPNPLLPDFSRLKLSGYIIPTFTVTSRSQAVPRDRLILGVTSSRSGIILEGRPYENWSYVLHVGFNATVLNFNNAAATRVVTGQDGDTTRFAFVTSVPIEEATATYSPFPFLGVTAGHVRIPFSVGAAAVITAQMFPTRPAPAVRFVTGPDDGALVNVDLLDHRIQFRGGVFNGSSLAFAIDSTATRTITAPVWSAFIDVHPLGKMPPREGAQVLGGPRVALGVGSLYRGGVAYDEQGYEASRFRDVRFAASARLAAWGLFVQGEYLRRLRTDVLSLRPSAATGVYVQGSFYYPLLKSFALGPLARYGYTTLDEAFSGQRITEFEAGMAFYPRADQPEPDVVRIIVEYLHESRVPFNESSNGAVANLQLKF